MGPGNGARNPGLAAHEVDQVAFVAGAMASHV